MSRKNSANSRPSSPPSASSVVYEPSASCSKTGAPKVVWKGYIVYGSPSSPTWIRNGYSVSRSSTCSRRSSQVSGVSSTMSSLRISARFSTEYGNPYTCPSQVTAAPAASDQSLAKSPSSIGSTTPLAVNSPSQSCAPTVRSGPSPVGTCAKKSGRISSKFLSTSSTVAPVSSSNCSTVEASAVARVSSTQIVRLPPSASGVSSVVVSSGASGVSSGLSDPPPHPARAKPKISTAAIPALLRMDLLQIFSVDTEETSTLPSSALWLLA